MRSCCRWLALPANAFLFSMQFSGNIPTMNTRSFYLFLMLLLVTLCAQSQPQPVPAIVPKERAFYSVTDVPLGPVLLEVGGMAFLPDGRLAVCTRRGDIWL